VDQIPDVFVGFYSSKCGHSLKRIPSPEVVDPPRPSLKVESALDTATCERGYQVNGAKMKALDIQGDAFHPEWSYTIDRD
jgi:hypothetical protein